MSAWNFADILTAIAQRRDDAPAVTDERGTTTWAELDRRTDALAQTLVARSLAPQSKVAVFARNCAEHLETYVACFKAALVPVNVNYRYGPAELRYLFSDADVAAVVVADEFAPTVRALVPELPLLHTTIVIGAAERHDDIDYERGRPRRGRARRVGTRCAPHRRRPSR